MAVAVQLVGSLDPLGSGIENHTRVSSSYCSTNGVPPKAIGRERIYQVEKADSTQHTTAEDQMFKAPIDSDSEDDCDEQGKLFLALGCLAP